MLFLGRTAFIRSLGTLIVASTLIAVPAHAATYTITDLGPPLSPAISCQGFGVNASGQAAGNISIDGTNLHAALYAGGGVTDLNTLGGVSSGAEGINDKGELAGYALTSTGATHAFLYNSTGIHDLTTLGGARSEATAINGLTQVVGNADLSNGDTHAFLWSTTAGIQDLKTLGGASSYATAINATGQVVGYSTITSGETHAFLWAGGKISDLGKLPNGVDSMATAIAADGTIVGTSHVDDADHAFILSAGKMTDLGPGCYPQAINKYRQVAGWSLTPDGLPEAMLWDGGKWQDLNTAISTDAGWWLNFAMSINDSGQIVGSGHHGATERAFLLTPVTPKYGDVNGDGAIDMADVAAALRMAAGISSDGSVDAADVAPKPSSARAGFGDGMVDIRDAIRILRKVRGLETAWP